MIKDNEVKITGLVTEVEPRTGVSSAGVNYIAGTLVVKVISNNVEMLIPVRYFSLATKKDGTANGLYNTYSKLSDYEGQRVTITGTLSEQRYWNESRGSITRYNEISLRFINLVKTTQTEDEATFVFGGFVTEVLHPIYAQDGATIKNYRMSMVQSNYNDTNGTQIELTLDPKNSKAIDALQSQGAIGTSMRLNGNLFYTVENREITEENDFGEPMVKTYQNNISLLMITGGKKVDEEFAYTQEEVQKFVAAIKEHDAEIEVAAKNKAVNNTSSGVGAVGQVNKPQATASFKLL